MINQDVYAKAIITYGVEMQSTVAIEELSELQKEICKMLRGIENKDHLTEEIADVQIMLDQLKIMYDIYEGDLSLVKIQKIERLKERLKDEKPSM